MIFMKFEIGKRYSWPDFHAMEYYDPMDEVELKEGVLIDVFRIRGLFYGKLLDRDNIAWAIPLDADYLEEYKEE